MNPRVVYGSISVVGVAAFAYPFWLPESAVPGESHATVAPLVAATLVGLAVLAVGLEVHRRRLNGATVALLGVLSASAGMLRLIDLPGGGSGVFFLVILAGAAFGARFGLLLGLSAMALSAVLTGGIGPWLPFQMMGLAWMGASAGAVGRLTRHLRPRVEVWALAALGWVWGFAVRRHPQRLVVAFRRLGGAALLAPEPHLLGDVEPLLRLLPDDLAGLGRRRSARQRRSHPPHGVGPAREHAAVLREACAGSGAVLRCRAQRGSDHRRGGEAGRSPALTRNRRPERSTRSPRRAGAPSRGCGSLRGTVVEYGAEPDAAFTTSPCQAWGRGRRGGGVHPRS